MENEVEVKLEDFLKRLFAKMEIESSAHHHEILPFIRWVRFSTLFKGLVSDCVWRQNEVNIITTLQL